jgi:hypothetical protein
MFSKNRVKPQHKIKIIVVTCIYFLLAYFPS